MLPNHKSSALGFALWLTTVATARPLESIFVPRTLAQAAPTVFPLPTSVPAGTTVQIDGSSSMAATNQTLKQRFENQFAGSNINLNYSGTPSALQALRDGKVDLAAIGRPLTQAERDQGFTPVSVGRGKIALIVSPENPFKGSISVPQFAKIVRGEITNWSQLGGEPGKIRFIDRPDLSDTRAAFSNYSVFIKTPYEVGTTATRTGEDSTQAVAQKLGKDGLSFAPANQVLNQPNLRIVRMHNTLPTDPRYPFSQPFYYVHKANPSPGAAAFLGYATADSGKEATQSIETNPASQGLNPEALLAAGSATAGALNTGAGAGSAPSSPGATTNTASPSTTGTTSSDGAQAIGATPTNTGTPSNDSGIPGWLWWLLPLGLAALLLGWLLRRRSTPPVAETPVIPPPEPQTPPPPPPPLMTPVESDGSLASRAGSVIHSDRASIAEVQSPTIPPEVAIGGAALAGAGAASVIHSGQTEPLEPPVIESEPPAIESEPPAVPLETPSADSSTLPVVAETTSVPVSERPLVEIREMPPIETPTSANVDHTTNIEPPEAPPAPEIDVPNGAILGGVAGLGATGAAAWMNRTRSDQPPQTELPEPEPLTSLDAIEPLDEVEDAPLDQPAIELDLDDAPYVMGEVPPMPQINEPQPERSAIVESEPSISGVTALGGVGLAAGLVGLANRGDSPQTEVEAARFDVGQTDLSSETLASVDEGLAELPDGYGESRIVLMPRDPQWAYAYWDVPNVHKSELRNQGGQNLVLRLYDVTDVNLAHQSPHSLQRFECDELARDWYVPIPVSDRDYLVEIGYLTRDGRWLMLARSLPVRVPPVYPSNWQEDQFMTLNWETELRDQTFLTLVSPTDNRGLAAAPNGMYDRIFDLSQGAELQRIAGSIFGSMQQVPAESIRSFGFPSGVGMSGLPTASGISGMFGIGMSGIGMSGIGMGAMPIRPRRFWLVADAELIIYGATEPGATVSIAGETIPLNPDGTFRFQMSFQDGLIDYPILAVAKDGEQTRSIHLKFNRETPSRNTNSKDEAIDEWQS